MDGLGTWGQLGEGDRVTVEGPSRAVKGWIAYDDEWVEYLLDDGRWLSVEDDRGLRFSLWEDQDTTWVPHTGLQLTYGGTTYNRTEHYRARWLAAGVEGMAGPGEVQVWEYQGPGDRLAAVEDWGDGPELSLGRVLSAQDVRR